MSSASKGKDIYECVSQEGPRTNETLKMSDCPAYLFGEAYVEQELVYVVVESTTTSTICSSGSGSVYIVLRNSNTIL